MLRKFCRSAGSLGRPGVRELLRGAAMFGLVFSRAMVQLVAALLGGYGIFCLIASFTVPSFGGDAFVMIAAASAMLHFHPS